MQSVHRSVAASDPGAAGLGAYRDRHAGGDVIVCGCGPSLNELPAPERFVTIGVNDVGRRFDPTYLVVVNPRSQFKGERFRYVANSNARVLFTQLDLGSVRPPVVRFKLGQYGGTDIGGDVLHYTQNSPYVAVCLAALMGARRIGLIGVDFTDDHFFAATGRHPLAGRLREIDAQYGRLAVALARRGVEFVNLSAASRLTSLRRMRVDAGDDWTPIAAQHPVTAAATAVRTHPGGSVMKIFIQKRSAGAVGQVLDALAETAARLGHTVLRDPQAAARAPRALAVVWNGRGHLGRGPVLFCEHGWLPRSDYQISPRGINAGSHVAPFEWDGTALTPEQDAALDAHLATIKSSTFSGYYQYMQADKGVPADLPPQFLLVPLQIESDTNIVRHAPAHLRTMQALIDHVSKVDPPWPVVFKQHPADVRHGSRHLRLRVRRRQDMIWAHTRGNIHQMLKSGACRGILTINSNVAHDGLLWDVPAIVLGRNVWPQRGVRLPFLTAVPRDWSVLAESATASEAIACRRAYAHFLMRSQWTLAQARDPQRVAALLAEAVASRADAARPAPNVTALRTSQPVINVVAEDRGWLFEAWKERFAGVAVDGFTVATSNAPLRHAAAWIFIRAREAAATPDPARTVVQLHDLFDDGLPGGVALRRCAGWALTHPQQRQLLADAGVDLARHTWFVQPVGFSHALPSAAAVPDPRQSVPAVAWIGRPAVRAGRDASGLDRFVEAMTGLRTQARVVLVGERLDRAARTLRAAGVACAVEDLRRCPPARTSDWIGRFDCVVVTSTADSGPWPLFDALNAGVPVVAAPVGWASDLLADGQCGRLAADAGALREAVESVLSEDATRHARREVLRARAAGYGIGDWVRANLQAAAELARPAVRRAA